jgi:MFS family permease
MKGDSKPSPRDRLTREEWAAVGVLGSMTFVSALHVGGVAAMLPAIASSIGLGLGRSFWISGSYLTSVAALLLLCGRVGDRVGLARLYKAGLVVFSAASLMCAWPAGAREFLSFRVLQGMGMAMLSATSPAILAAAVRPALRGRALGLQAAMTAAGVFAGPALAGFLTVHISWAAIFGIAGTMTALLIPVTWRVFRHHPGKPDAEPFDPIGAAAWTLGIVGLFSTLTLASSPGDHRGSLAAAAAGAIVCSAVLVIRERAAHPFLRIHSAASLKIVRFAVAEFLNYTCLYGIGFLAPIVLIRILGLGPLACGTALTLAAIPRIVTPLLGGVLADRYPRLGVAALGTLVMAAGLIAFGFASGTGRLGFVVSGVVAINSGVGLFGPPNLKSALVCAQAGARGQAASLLATGRSLGMALGVSGGGLFLALSATGVAKMDLAGPVRLCCVPLALAALASWLTQVRSGGLAPSAASSIVGKARFGPREQNVRT